MTRKNISITDDETLQRLARLKDRTGAISDAEVVRQALKVFEDRKARQ